MHSEIAGGPNLWISVSVRVLGKDNEGHPIQLIKPGFWFVATNHSSSSFYIIENSGLFYNKHRNIKIPHAWEKAEGEAHVPKDAHS